MIPCSDYPPTENGEGMTSPKDSVSSPSLVEELMGMVDAYANDVAVFYDPNRPSHPRRLALRSRLTALETELNGYRERDARFEEVLRARAETTISLSPRTTEPL